MPIYEYRCSKCGHELEAIQKISDAPLVRCPACQQDSLQKLVSAASFRLKGGGWYETDFKKGNKKHLADSGSSTSGSSSTEGKSGSKESSGTAAASGDTKKSSSGDGKSGAAK